MWWHREDAREGKWRGNWRMEWVASTLHTTSEHGVSGITTADAHTSAASSRLNWRLRRFKWTRPFRRKTKYGFCECAITFKLASNTSDRLVETWGTGYFEPAVARCVPQYTASNDRLPALTRAFVSNRLQLSLAKQALNILQHFRTFACN